MSEHDETYIRGVRRALAIACLFLSVLLWSSWRSEKELRQRLDETTKQLESSTASLIETTDMLEKVTTTLNTSTERLGWMQGYVERCIANGGRP